MRLKSVFATQPLRGPEQSVRLLCARLKWCRWWVGFAIAGCLAFCCPVLLSSKAFPAEFYKEAATPTPTPASRASHEPSNSQRNNGDFLAEQDFAEAETLAAQWRKEDFEHAQGKYTLAARLWQQSRNPSAAANAYRRLGDLFFIGGKYDEALRAYRHSWELNRSARNLQGETEALNNIGYAYLYLGQNGKAEAHFRKSLDFYRRAFSQRAEVVFRRGLARSLNNLAEVEYSFGRIDRAEELLNQSLDYWRECDDPEGTALAYLNLGYTKADSGQITEAVEAFQQSLTLWEGLQNKRGEAMARAALGGVNSLLGEKQQAINAYHVAQQLFSVIGDEQGRAVALTGLGQAYEDLNQSQNALDNYRQALQIHLRTGNKDYEAVIRYNIGRVCLTLKDYPQALDFYKQSLSISRQLGKLRIEAYARSDLATIYESLGEKRNFFELYQELLQLYRRVDDRRGQAKILVKLGDSCLSRGDAQRALTFYLQSVKLSRLSKDPDGEAEALFKSAQAKSRQGNSDSAMTDIRQAITILETLRLHVYSPAARIAYFSTSQKYFDLYIELLMQSNDGRPSEESIALALQLSEQARARSLLEILAVAGINPRQGVTDSLLEKEQRLQKELKLKAFLLNRMSSSNASAEEIARAEEGVRALDLQLEAVEAEINEQNPLLTTLAPPKVLGLQAIQQEIGPDSLLLEYYLGSHRSYLWAVTSNSIKSYELPNRQTLETLVLETYRLLTARQTAVEDVDEYQAQVHKADEELPLKIAALSKLLLASHNIPLDRKRLLVVANGALQYLPFDVLNASSVSGQGVESVPEAPDAYSPLALSFEVINLPSFSALAAIRRSGKEVAQPGREIALFADPVFTFDDPRARMDEHDVVAIQLHSNAEALRVFEEQRPGQALSRLQASYREAQTIGSFFSPSESLLVTGFDASLRRATDGELKHYRIVHFATHGLINSQHPELSGLVLSLVNKDGRPEDGFLQLRDIYKLDLSAELVVLSACQTGLGKEVNGEGLVGLTHGFFNAGAKSVVASLWKVDDRATSELMIYFYEAMVRDGLPPSTALTTAKRRMMRQERWRAPYYWAAFTLQGEYGNPHTRQNDSSHSLFQRVATGVILSGLSIIFLLVWRRKRKHP